MLHQSVANLLVHVFEGANARSEMQEYFIVKCNLLGRLMDSFAEVVPGDQSFSLRDNAPVPDFPERKLEISMKGVKMGVEGVSVNTLQANDMGSSDGKQHALSDDIIHVSDDDVDAVLEQQVEQQEAADAAAAAIADSAEGDVSKEPDVSTIETSRPEGSVIHAKPSSIVIPRSCSSRSRSGFVPVRAWISADLPWSTWPAVPMTLIRLEGLRFKVAR